MRPRALIDDEEPARYALSSIREALVRAGWAAPTPEGTPHVARP